MNVYAIGDLHLPGGDDKPMDVFGPHWEGHFEKIRADWRARVGAEDAVLLPGDISWAMQAQDAMEDLRAIGATTITGGRGSRGSGKCCRRGCTRYRTTRCGWRIP